MFYPWTTVVGFFIGAAIGSFLNVVVYRLPRGMSLIAPPSHCPACGHRLGVLDLVPVLSYVASGGKCRHCKGRVSARYVVIELITGSLWAAFWWQNLVEGEDVARFLVLAAFASVLVAASAIDLATYTIPIGLNALLLLFGLGYNAWLIVAGADGAWAHLGSLALPASVAGALVGVAVFWGIAFFGRLAFRKDAMGHGDIMLARGLGAVLFPATALVGFGLAVLVAVVFGVLQVFLRRPPETVEESEGEGEEEPPETVSSLVRSGLGYALAIDVVGIVFPSLDRWWFGQELVEEPLEDDWTPGFTHIPFGPYLAAGAILAALFDRTLLGWVQSYWNWATGGP